MLKKTCIALVCVFVMFSFAACGGRDNEKANIECECVECKLKRDYLKQFMTSTSITVDDITILKHYGTYNGCTVITTNLDIIYGQVYWVNGLVIGGATFRFRDYDIIVYKESHFYDLKDAYDNSYLTENDLRAIADQYEEFIMNLLEGLEEEI